MKNEPRIREKIGGISEIYDYNKKLFVMAKND